jgi:transmembrane sensor
MISQAAETEEAAARWLLRQEEAGWSEQDRVQLEAWLNAAPEHRVAYWRLEYGWRRADRIADLADLAEPQSPARNVPADTPIAGG